MLRIRLHGRGGQGMKTASRILGTAFFLEGFEVQDAPRYGAERRGAPIFAYVRAGREPIQERGIIRHPDLVVVADDTLVPIPAAGVLAGIDPHTVMLINSHEAAEIWRGRLNLAGPLLVLPVVEEVEDRAQLPYIGTSCAGAAACLVGEVSAAALEQAIRQELSQLSAAVIQRNVDNALAAYASLENQAGIVAAAAEGPAEHWDDPQWVDLPFDAVGAAAPSIHAAATSEQSQTGLWRTMRPVIDYQRCNRCWWVCSTFCPDGAIKVLEDGRPDIDYDHCKGCLVCVAQCPPHAIEAIPEHEFQAEEVET